MPLEKLTELESEFREALVACQQLYLSSARFCIEQHPNVVHPSAEAFVGMMDSLHKGLVVKVYMEMSLADKRWVASERRLAQILLAHVWSRSLVDEQLREVACELSDQSSQLKWYSLIRPFAEIGPLRERIGSLETIVVRLANLVAKSDGHLGEAESRRLRGIQHELETHLRPLTLDEPEGPRDSQKSYSQAVRNISEDVQALPQTSDGQLPKDLAHSQPAQTSLESLLVQLDGLIGLQPVKNEIRTLANYLQLQRQRRLQGLPETPISLHMVFTGNPGTGKTTVARLVGKILGAMGILAKGHLVETDRSGLVAEFIGQTGPRANTKIDEAIDGVLFIDEAYSLVSKSGNDAYGHEAIQTLLKRMEDDRDRLVVILAGYPQPMEQLLRSNPGLSSRFSRTLQFDDYDPVSLGQIFGRLCAANRYELPAEFRAQLLIGLQWMYDRRDERFGNGRLIRNVFEASIRRLANRIAGITPLTHELLTLLQSEDLDLPQIPPHYVADHAQCEFEIRCPTCDGRSRLKQKHLGRRVKCKACSSAFTAEWGRPI